MFTENKIILFDSIQYRFLYCPSDFSVRGCKDLFRAAGTAGIGQILYLKILLDQPKIFT